MNSIVNEFSSQRVPTTIALAFGATVVTSSANWATTETLRYSPPPKFGTYSEVRQNLVYVDLGRNEQAKFEQKISEIYSALVSEQVPLDQEIASIWEAHAEELYES